jgi:hypothetical protein
LQLPLLVLLQLILLLLLLLLLPVSSSLSAPQHLSTTAAGADCEK